MAEEVRRRMMNQDKHHDREERIILLKKFSQKLIDSGYGKENRRDILKSGMTRYYRITLMEEAGIRKL